VATGSIQNYKLAADMVDFDDKPVKDDSRMMFWDEGVHTRARTHTHTHSPLIPLPPPPPLYSLNHVNRL